MKLFVVASANNINSDIDLSEPFLTEERAAERLESDYKNAVERFFGEDQDSIAEEDEMTISESGYTVYHSKSQNLEFAQICEIDVPDLAPSFAMTMAAANLEASDHRSRGRAFAKWVERKALSSCVPESSSSQPTNGAARCITSLWAWISKIWTAA